MATPEGMVPYVPWAIETKSNLQTTIELCIDRREFIAIGSVSNKGRSERPEYLRNSSIV